MSTPTNLNTAAASTVTNTTNWPTSYQEAYDESIDQLNKDLATFEQQVAQYQSPTAQQIEGLAIFKQLEADIDNVGKLTNEMQNSKNPSDQATVHNRDGLFGQVSGFFQNGSIGGISFQSVADEDNLGGDGSDDLANYLSTMLNESGMSDLSAFIGDITSYRARH